MKIVRLDESKKLYEAEDEAELSSIDPSKDSVSDIADAIQADIADASNGTAEISDANAKAVAQDAASTAKEIGASSIAIDPNIGNDVREWDTLGVQNDLTKLLDFAYKNAVKNPNSNNNVLIEGLPGSGKSSIVRDWANNHSPKIEIFEINVSDPELEKSIFGLDLRDMNSEDKNRLVKQYGAFLERLNKPNTVLFLDELNRGKTHIRRAMLDLVLNHESPDLSKPGGKRYYPNLLFTIACQNPSGMTTDQGAQELSDPEKTRFSIKYQGSFDSTPERTREFFNKYFNKKIKTLNTMYKDNTSDPDYLNLLHEYLALRRFLIFMTKDPEFRYLRGDDSRDLDIINGLSDKKQTLFTQRGLTDIVEKVGTYKETFNTPGYAQALYECMKWTDTWRPEDLQMVKNIVDKYPEPTFEQLIAAYNNDDDAACKLDTNIVNDAVVDDTNTPADIEDPNEKEDDDLIFGNSGGVKSTGNSKASAGTIDSALNDILLSF